MSTYKTHPYTVVGGNPFTMYTGTTTFTGLRVVGNCRSLKEASKLVKDSWDECSGLLIILFKGQALEYDNEGRPLPPKG